MFVAMNRFQVVPGQEAAFETVWRERESQLASVPGFLQFALLRGAEGEYISHSSWRDQAAFQAWTESQAFQRGHRGASMAGILAGPPQLRTYEAALLETPAGRVPADPA